MESLREKRKDMEELAHLKKAEQGATPLGEQIRNALLNTEPVFPGHALAACQGVAGAFSQSACEAMFQTPEIVYFPHFNDVFQAVESRRCRYGVLPIENSTAGSVNEVYDLMRKHKFYIVRGVKLRVAHFLLAKPGTKLSDVREVYSKDIALEQCGRFLSGLKNARPVPCVNTAAAAKFAAETDRSGVAAIASRSCMKLYGLCSLADNIQNSGHNYTRFICISKELEIYPGADKISLMLSLSHSPGSLYRFLSRFSELELNLTKIESRPIPDRDFEFMFYFDFNADISDPRVQRLICDLDGEFGQFAYLGSYSETVSGMPPVHDSNA